MDKLTIVEEKPKTNYDRFHYYLQEIESPDIYIDWNLYYIISSCLQRKVWLGNSINAPIYPNLYVVFVAEPGFGKGVPLMQSAKILNNIIGNNGNQLVNIAPNTVTFEKMIKRLQAAERLSEKVGGGQPLYLHTSVSFLLTELGTLFRESSANVSDLIQLLTDGWDCGDYKQDTIKHGVIEVKNICINFAGACTPDWFGRKNGPCLTDGWNARTIYVYGDKPRKRTTFLFFNEQQNQVRAELLIYLRALASLPAGPLDLVKSKEALDWIDDWYKTKFDKEEKNNNKALSHYYGRKKMHLIKLTIVQHFIEKLTMWLDVEDAVKALEALNKVEKIMHYAFMGVKNDNPLFDLAENIKKCLFRSKGCTMPKITLIEKFYSQGDDESIAKALDFLENTGQIEKFSEKLTNRPMYKIKGGGMNGSI